MRIRVGGCLAAGALALGLFGLVGAQPVANLAVTVNNVRSAEGQVRVAVYRPGNWLQAVPTARVWVPAQGKRVTVEFELAPDEYAVAVLHDENDNGKMDYRFLRIPKEPYGFSNNAKPRLQPPKFEDAAFTLGTDGLAITIRLAD